MPVDLPTRWGTTGREKTIAPPVMNRSNRERAHNVPLARCVAGKSGASPEGRRPAGRLGTSGRRFEWFFERSAERARLAHHRQRRRGRHDRAPLLAARSGRSTGIAGGSTGRCATGRGHRRGHLRRCATAAAATGTAARRAKLHERGAAAATARAAETTGASGGCHKAAEDECQTDGTRHDYKTPPLPRPDGRDDVMRRPRRR